MRSIKQYWQEDRIFLLFWMLLQAILGWGDRIWMGPYGMHQGAQADRAGVAWNFYHETWNLFLPRVMENRAAEGIAGMEFPIISYAVGMIWRAFGHHDVIYRLTVGVIVTIGYWSLWRFLGRLGIVGIGRVAVILLVFLSPIMVFYTWNFLPDAAALGLSFAGLYRWFRWRMDNENTENKFDGIWVCLLFSLSGLVKVSMLIPFFSILCIELLQSNTARRWRNFFVKPKWRVANSEYGETIVLEDENETNNRGTTRFHGATILELLSVYGGVLLLVLAWYMYSGWLTSSTWNIHFIQQVNPVNSMDELKDVLRFISNVWSDSIFYGSALFWLIVLWAISLIRKSGMFEIWDWLSVFNFLGFISFFLLFSKQFRFHDYYFLSAWPFVFTAVLVIFRSQLQGRRIFVGFSGIVAVVFFVYYPIRGIGHSSKMLNYRLQSGNYYCQNIIVNEQGLTAIGDWLNTKEDPLVTKEILVIGDPSPSTALYYLQRKGLRFAPDFDSISCRGIWNKRKELEEGIANRALEWKWPWDFRYGKNRKLGYVVAQKNYIDTLNISSYIVDIKHDKNLIYSSGDWNLYEIKNSN